MPRLFRVRRAPLGATIAALTLVPVGGFALLGVQRIETERSLAEQASAVVDVVALQHEIAQVYPPAQLEKVAMQGLARLDAIGVPRDLVVMFSGVDLEERFALNVVGLDATIDLLAADYPTLQLADGSNLGDRLTEIRSELAAQRSLSDQRAAEPDDIADVFDGLFATLELALGATPTTAAGLVEQSDDRLRLEVLASVLVSGGDRVQAVLDGSLDRTSDRLEQIDRATAAHAAHLDSFIGLLGPEHRPAFEALQRSAASLPTLPMIDPAADGDDLAVAMNPDIVRQTATVIVSELDYLDVLRVTSEAYQDDVTAEVQATAESASARARRTEILLWATITATVGLIALVLWSVLSSIRRLTQRAEAIGNGLLEIPPLPVRGPSDVRNLTATVNDMHATLQRANAEIQRLATGDLDRPTVELPGAIGVAMRESVDHLAAVTARLHRSEQISSAIVSQAGDAIWTTEPDGRIRTANDASAELTGIPSEEQIGTPLTEIITTTAGEATVVTGPARGAKVLVSSNVIDVDDEPIITVIAHDISERSKFEQQLHYQARHDALTGLPNRFAVLDHLESRAGDGAELAALFVDLDGFKNVNDKHGHAVGDSVLANVARRLERRLAGEHFLGRLGGDEFVVVVAPLTDAIDVVALGELMIRELERPQEFGGQQFALSASVGVSVPAIGTSGLDTIRQADNALYHAKRRGRGRVEVFDQAMQDQMEREAELELALRHAVRNGELLLHYQPTFDLTTGRIVGAEALVRWNRPGHGLVMPGAFIPVAERTSLIFEIERWVLTEACQQIAAWQQRDPSCTLRVAVNVSGRHLIEGHLLADVDMSLSLTGADPRMLELELTETQLVEDVARATAILTELRQRGIRIAMDDFGTGYSSMTYMRDLPLDVVKIDRSFVARATDDGFDSTVIRSLVTIGRVLQLEIVAEGVETEAQLEFVRAQGCHRAQGFLLARPMPIDDIERLVFGAGDSARREVAEQVG